MLIFRISAQKLSTYLNKEIKELFEKRTTVKHVVMCDWNTCHKTYIHSKLEILFNILTKVKFIMICTLK